MADVGSASMGPAEVGVCEEGSGLVDQVEGGFWGDPSRGGA